jgi:predicted TPR repeat methyltransferase
MSGPIFVSSGDLVVDRRYRWALDYLARGDASAAVDLLEQVVAAVPGFASAWFALAEIREARNDRAGAIAAFRAASAADADDIHAAGLHLARLGAAKATAGMMTTYVRRLFDQQAARFDRDLLDRLGYCAPQLLHEAVGAARPGGPGPRFKAMLDLGCGTGLAGAAFRAEVEWLSGIDVSPAMIEEAKRKAIYDQLETGEIMDRLAAEAAARHAYDLIVAADVLVYLHDLAEMAAAVGRVLTPVGLFAFTVETHPGSGVIQRATLRYAHSADHVRAAVGRAGLVLVQLSDAATRTERGDRVAGLLGLATRTARR